MSNHICTYEKLSASTMYRLMFINQVLNNQSSDLFVNTGNFQICKDENIYKQCKSYRWSRMIYQKDICDRLLYMKRKYNFKIICDFDDDLFYQDIPDFNIAKQGIKHTYNKDGIKKIFDIADYITVTTNNLKNHYANNLQIDNSKIKVIDNYLPNDFLNIFNLDEVNKNYYNGKKNIFTIVFCCGLTHFDLNNIGFDDFSHIQYWIVKNRKKYKFVFIGGINSFLYQYKNDFICIGQTHFNEYANIRKYFKPNLFIQPLYNCYFNTHKSAIKLYQADKQGIPILLQNMFPYKEKGTTLLFDTQYDLDEKVSKLLNNEDIYFNEVIKAQQRSKKYYLQDHINKWKTLMY